MSDSPRTDAESLGAAAFSGAGDIEVVPADFARKLERDINGLQALLEIWFARLEYSDPHGDKPKVLEALRRLKP